MLLSRGMKIYLIGLRLPLPWPLIDNKRTTKFNQPFIYFTVIYRTFANEYMGRILSIDYGRKRSGIAVSDLMQIIAYGLTTVPTHQLSAFLSGYLQQEPVERIIIGLPKQMNYEDSENAERVKSFVQSFKKQFPDIPIEFVDERFTSVLAQRTMLDGGLKKKDRQNKSLVDEISATIILQSYLENKRFIELK